MMVIAYEAFVKCSKIGTPSADKPVVYEAFVIPIMYHSTLLLNSSQQ